jgi:uncharacterized membrane protein HdeD (DUF308 family)
MLTTIIEISRTSWMYLVRGLLAIAFGILMLIWPKSTMSALILVIGAFVLMDGIVTVIAGFSSSAYLTRWWALVLEGLVGIGIGWLALSQPAMAVAVLGYFIGAWALLTGIFEVVAARELRRVIPGEWTTLLLGVLSIVLGVLLFVFPSEAAAAIGWAIGIYAIVFGIVELIFAFRLRGLGRELKEASGPIGT